MDELALSLLSAEIPPSLRPISPFLSEAQRMLSNAYDPRNASTMNNRKKIAMYCINHSFKLLNVFETNIDDATRNALANFVIVRDALAMELNVTAEMVVREQQQQQQQLQQRMNLKIVVPHAESVIISEAEEIVQLAEEQLIENLRDDAASNFHTAYRTRQASQLLENYVTEHFGGATCSEIYEVHASSKLGKGSYGSVYLATHRRTGDERAVKVKGKGKINLYST